MTETPGQSTTLRTPPPLPPRWVNAVPLVAAGTAMWFVALCGLVVARVVFHTPATEWVWVCLSGWLLGFAGFAVMFWQRSAARRGRKGAQRV